MPPNSKTVRALSKMKWFPDKSMHEAKLVAGASELVEPVKDGKLAVAFGTAGAMALAWKKLISSLCLLSPPEQGSGVSTREARASESDSSTRMNVLVILAGSWAEVSSPREIAGGAPRPTGMTKVGTSSG